MLLRRRVRIRSTARILENLNNRSIHGGAWNQTRAYQADSRPEPVDFSDSGVSRGGQLGENAFARDANNEKSTLSSLETIQFVKSEAIPSLPRALKQPRDSIESSANSVVTTFAELGQRLGPPIYHNQKQEKLLHILLHRFLVTALNETKAQSFFNDIGQLPGHNKKSADAVAPPTFNSVPRVMRYNLIKIFYRDTLPEFQQRYPVNDTSDLDKINLDELMQSISDSTKQSLLQSLSRHFQVNSFEYELSTLHHDTVENDRNQITSPYMPEELKTKLQALFESSVQHAIIPPVLIVKVCEALAASKEPLRANILELLLHQFNKLGLHNYSSIIYEICQQQPVAVSESLFRELLDIGSHEKFAALVKLLLRNRKNTSQTFRKMFFSWKLRTNYNHTYENVAGPAAAIEANKDESIAFLRVFEMKSQEMLPPLKHGMIANYYAPLLYNDNYTEKFKNIDNFFAAQRKNAAFARMLCENQLPLREEKYHQIDPKEHENSFGKLVMQKIPEEQNAVSKFNTVSVDTFLTCMRNCLRWKDYAMIDLLAYKFILNSYFLSPSEDAVPELRVNVSSDFHLKHQYLAANNLAFTSISGTAPKSIDESTSDSAEQPQNMALQDTELFFSVELVDIYLEKILATGEKDQLKWMAKIVEFIHLRPIIFAALAQVNNLFVFDRKAFDRRYNGMFSIEEIYQHEIFNSLNNNASTDHHRKKISTKILQKLYVACFNLQEYEIIKELETKCRLDFDRIVDKQLRIKTKKVIDDAVRDIGFKKTTQSWLNSEGKLSIKSFFL